uniref:Uncharacterized protein n=1 Tax=Cacopsylla melanoneura TaxID=428564 RepID=A0A8D8U055_9HEMI
MSSYRFSTRYLSCTLLCQPLLLLNFPFSPPHLLLPHSLHYPLYFLIPDFGAHISSSFFPTFFPLFYTFSPIFLLISPRFFPHLPKSSPLAHASSFFVHISFS